MRPTLLITGGTGTLGQSLARRMAAAPDAPRVVVLSRDPVRAQRVLEGCGIGVIRGDLRAGAALGLDAGDRAALERDVTGILHCAAATSFTLPLEEARAVNVEGTRAILEFAAGCPNLERIGCVSTVYVAGRRCGLIREDDLGANGAGFVNSYEQSKSEMEGIVRDAMPRLPIAVYRSSTLIGDSCTGEVRGFNAVHHAIRLLYQGLAPMIPGDPTVPVDLIADDSAADALSWLFSRAFEPGRTYHLSAGAIADGGGATLDLLIDATMDAFRRHRPAWRKRTIERPVLVDLATYELFVRSVEEAGNDVLRQATRAVRSFAYQLAHPKTFDTRHTDAGLAGSGIVRPRLLGYYERVVRHCIETSWGMAGR